MKLLLFQLLAVLMLLTACKKKKQVELQEESTCKNFTQCINDTLISLITVQTSSSVSIHKTQNGTTTVLLSQTGFEFWGASISPDRSKFICFKSTTANAVDVNDYTAAELWLFNIDGTNGHAITDLSSQSLNGMGMAKWAPDGFHLIFAGQKNETDGNLHWNIYLTDTLGSLATKMNTRLGDFKYPSFANGDMSKIVYEAWITGVTISGSVFDTEVHTASINGAYQITSEQRITDNGYTEYSPCYSPDNASLVYCQNTSLATGTAVQLYIATISSGSKFLLLNNNNINENPVWCQTNNKIYYLNKTSSWCFEKCNRIDISGLNNAMVYQQMNSQMMQVDIR